MDKYEAIRQKQNFICDMDGVIYHGNKLIPHVKEFIDWLDANGKNYLFLTNGSGRSPRELAQKLARMGLHVGEEHFYTSAQATAAFLQSQCPGGDVFVIHVKRHLFDATLAKCEPKSKRNYFLAESSASQGRIYNNKTHSRDITIN